MSNDEIKKRLRGFQLLGVQFSGISGSHARGRCPFCTDRRHKNDADKIFCVNLDSLCWDCKSCGEKGDFPQFLAERSRYYIDHTTEPQLRPLADDRGLQANTLKKFGVSYIPAQNRFLIPIRRGDKIIGMHRYAINGGDRKNLSVPGSKNGVFYRDAKLLAAARHVWVCEGEWDTFALDEAIRRASEKHVAVIGISGASAATEALVELVQGKEVTLALDNDKAGFDADAKLRVALSSRVRSLRSVHWPSDKPEKYDIRDAYIAYLSTPKKLLNVLDAWAGEDPRVVTTTGDSAPAHAPAKRKAVRKRAVIPTRAQIIKAYKKWLYLPDPEIIDVIYGTVLANRLDGDPLWLLVVGPPGCGKTAGLLTLSKAFSVMTTTTITPATLISGMKLAGGADPSLIPKLDGKVLIIKDFTTILSMRREAREEIFGILRDAYDGEIEKWFGHGVHRHYKSKFGILAGVTAKIEEMSNEHTVVGERFVKYYMRPGGASRINVGEPAIRRVVANLGKESAKRDELTEISRLFLDADITMEPPKIGKYEADKIIALAQWTAAMRGAVARDKYTKKLVHLPATEIGTRLAGQYCKLASGLAMFRGRAEVTHEDLLVVAKVARDSAPDLRQTFIREMYVRQSNNWITSNELADAVRLPNDTVYDALVDANMLGLVNRKAHGGQVTWQLSKSMMRIMHGLDLYVQEKRMQLAKGAK
jgi:hypothetical protein